MTNHGDKSSPKASARVVAATRRLFDDVFGDDAEAIALELAQGASDPSDPPEMVAFLEELAAYERATFAVETEPEPVELEAAALRSELRDSLAADASNNTPPEPPVTPLNSNVIQVRFGRSKARSTTYFSHLEPRELAVARAAPRIRASDTVENTDEPSPIPTSPREVGSVDTAAGEIVFFDDGERVFVSIDPPSAPKRLLLGGVAYSLDAWGEGLTVWRAHELTPQTLIDFLMACDKAPDQASIFWE